MFYAVIRNQRGALHVIGEVDAYSIETLRHHVAGAVREAGPSAAKLQIDVDPAQRNEFRRRTRRWVKRLVMAGVTVAISSLPLT